MTNEMTNEQMELGLVNGRSAANRRSSRVRRADWWFAQMRRAVNAAMDWQPAPPPRPEQVWFPNAQRHIEV